MSEIDFADLENYTSDGVADTQVINDLVEQYLGLMDEIKILEDKLKDKTEAVNSIIQDRLPDALIESNIDSITVRGMRVSLKDFVSASIPAQSSIDKCRDAEKRDDMIRKRNAWFKFLRESGNGSLIKNEVKANFGKGEDEQAAKLLQQLAEAGIAAIQQESVHPSTLSSFAKEQIANNVDFPEELGVFQGQKVEIKKTK